MHKLRETLEQLSLTARLELATEQRANEYLERLRAEYSARRDVLRQERDTIDRQQEQMQCDLSAMNQRISTLPTNGTNQQQAELKELRDQCSVLQARLTEHSGDQHRLATALADVQDLLARTLEQLPTNTLALQRARARLDSLDAERKVLEARAAQSAAMGDARARFESQAEQLQIDITVCRTLLTEVQGKLGRLEPVRYELLRQN